MKFFGEINDRFKDNNNLLELFNNIKNMVTNNNKEGEVRLFYGSVGPEYFMNNNKNHNNGVCGWYGPGVSTIPLKAITFDLQIIINTNHVKTIQECLDKYQISHQTRIPILELSQTIIVKEPWFHEVLDIIRKYKPNMTEEILIGHFTDGDGNDLINESVCHYETTEPKYDTEKTIISFNIVVDRLLQDTPFRTSLPKIFDF